MALLFAIVVVSLFIASLERRAMEATEPIVFYRKHGAGGDGGVLLDVTEDAWDRDDGAFIELGKSANQSRSFRLRLARKCRTDYCVYVLHAAGSLMAASWTRGDDNAAAAEIGPFPCVVADKPRVAAIYAMRYNANSSRIVFMTTAVVQEVCVAAPPSFTARRPFYTLNESLMASTNCSDLFRVTCSLSDYSFVRVSVKNVRCPQLTPAGDVDLYELTLPRRVRTLDLRDAPRVLARECVEKLQRVVVVGSSRERNFIHSLEPLLAPLHDAQSNATWTYEWTHAYGGYATDYGAFGEWHAKSLDTKLPPCLHTRTHITALASNRTRLLLGIGTWLSLMRPPHYIGACLRELRRTLLLVRSQLVIMTMPPIDAGAFWYRTRATFKAGDRGAYTPSAALNVFDINDALRAFARRYEIPLFDRFELLQARVDCRYDGLHLGGGANADYLSKQQLGALAFKLASTC